jgi:hypothetical protein
VKPEVATAVEELRRQFSASAVTATEDGQGGAFVFIESVALGDRFTPASTWMGFQIPAQYPYADIYPVFIDQGVKRSNGAAFEVPVTLGHNFQGRAAIQISRRNGSAQAGHQKATAKILKILHFLQNLP